MTKHYGDRASGHGDQDTYENTSGSTIEEGMFVSPDGSGGVVPIDGASGDDFILGIAGDDIEAGEIGLINLRGKVYGRVESDVTAGTELVSPDTGTDGAAGIAAAGTGAGNPSITEDPVSQGSGFIAPVLLR